MPDASQFVAAHMTVVDKVTRSVGRAFACLGHDADDVRQEACLKLVRLARSDRVTGMPDPEGYLFASIRRHVRRALSAKLSPPVPVADQVLALAEDRGVGFACEFVTDVLASAPPAVAEFLRRAVIDQVPPCRGEHPETVRRTRAKAGRWLAAQIEGVKS